jgi:hypothetical protein
MAAGVWLLARPGAPGGGAVRRAIAQLRGAEGQPRTCRRSAYASAFPLGRDVQPAAVVRPGPRVSGAGGGGLRCADPRGRRGHGRLAATAAAAIAVAAAVILGLLGVLAGAQWVWDPGSAPVGPYSGYTIGFYGAVPLDGGISGPFAGLRRSPPGCSSPRRRSASMRRASSPGWAWSPPTTITAASSPSSPT